LAIPFAVSIVCIFFAKMISTRSQTADIEYWGNYAVEANHYEAWDEEVPCRHPKYCTRTVTKTNSQGKSYTTTEEYQCGYQHAYDVDYHPEYWNMVGNGGNRYSISKSAFEDLTNKWRNKKFVDLGRDYHSIDGDKYTTKWNGDDQTLRDIVTTHTYENRVQAAKTSLYNFPEVTDFEKREYGIFGYPEVSDYQCYPILGSAPDMQQGGQILRVANAKLGRTKQVRLWVLIFENQPIESAFVQEAYWKGGNKNEFITWTPNEELKFAVRDKITEMDVLDMSKAADIIVREVKAGFVRREFAEFSYLSVRVSGKAVFITFIIVIVVNVGISIWAVKNEMDEEKLARMNKYKRTPEWIVKTKKFLRIS
jgi:hypothetical protein